MVERVSFLIDGFNVYHSVKAALASLKITHAKWLNYQELCNSLLSDVSDFSSGATVAQVRYFTALANHVPNPVEVVRRHRTFIAALESLGVEVILGNFKKKNQKCKSTCKNGFFVHEEKETDVNIAIHLLKAFLQDECDTTVIISGDTDLIPAVTMAKTLFPNKRVAIGFPYKRANAHYKLVADFTFKITAERYEKCQLINPITLADGSTLARPTGW